MLNMQTNPSGPSFAASCSNGSTWDLGSTWWLSPFLRMLCSSHLLRLLVTQTTWNPSCRASLPWDISRAGWCSGREVCCPFWCGGWPFGVSSPGCVLSQAPSWWDGVRSKKSLGSALQEWKHSCVTNVVLGTHSKHSPVPANVEEMNVFPPQTSTLGIFLPQKIPSRGTLV